MSDNMKRQLRDDVSDESSSSKRRRLHTTGSELRDTTQEATRNDSSPNPASPDSMPPSSEMSAGLTPAQGFCRQDKEERSKQQQQQQQRSEKEKLAEDSPQQPPSILRRLLISGPDNPPAISAVKKGKHETVEPAPVRLRSTRHWSETELRLLLGSLMVLDPCFLRENTWWYVSHVLTMTGHPFNPVDCKHKWEELSNYALEKDPVFHRSPMVSTLVELLIANETEGFIPDSHGSKGPTQEFIDALATLAYYSSSGDITPPQTDFAASRFHLVPFTATRTPFRRPPPTGGINKLVIDSQSRAWSPDHEVAGQQPLPSKSIDTSGRPATPDSSMQDDEKNPCQGESQDRGVTEGPLQSSESAVTSRKPLGSLLDTSAADAQVNPYHRILSMQASCLEESTEQLYSVWDPEQVQALVDQLYQSIHTGSTQVAVSSAGTQDYNFTNPATFAFSHQAIASLFGAYSATNVPRVPSLIDNTLSYTSTGGVSRSFTYYTRSGRPPSPLFDSSPEEGEGEVDPHENIDLQYHNLDAGKPVIRKFPVTSTEASGELYVALSDSASTDATTKQQTGSEGESPESRMAMVPSLSPLRAVPPSMAPSPPSEGFNDLENSGSCKEPQEDIEEDL